MYELEQPVLLSQASVYWWDDRPWGGSRIPLWWRVEYKDDSGRWKSVDNKSDYKVEQDVANRVEFSPLKTKYVRLKFQLEQGQSAGIYEFEVK